MLLWFVFAAPFLVAEIFKSPMVDYRMVMVGAVLPVIEVLIGRPFVLHTLLAPVVALTVVMMTTVGRRLRRRRLLGIPIGMFFHLVLDGTWTSATLFWWPVLGTSFSGQSVPEATALGWRLLMEVTGIGIGVLAIRRYRLDDAENRARLLRTGQLATGWAA